MVIQCREIGIALWGIGEKHALSTICLNSSPVKLLQKLLPEMARVYLLKK